MSDLLKTRLPDVDLSFDHDPANPCPALAEKDFAALRQSIEEHGYLEAWPIVVSAGPACAGEIIDGFHRTKLCAEMGVTPHVVAVPCPTEAEFLILQVRANLARRQLTEVDRYRLGVKLQQAFALQAAARKAAAGTANLTGNAVQPVSPGQLTGTKGDTRDLVAAEVGLSGKQFERIAKVMESDDEVLKAGLESQTLSVYGAFKQLRDKEQQDTIDTAIKAEAQAEREIEEAYFSTHEDRAETLAAERMRLAAEVVRRSMELDALITKNVVTASEIVELRSRPHTFRGVARRINEWMGEIEEVL